MPSKLGNSFYFTGRPLVVKTIRGMTQAFSILLYYISLNLELRLHIVVRIMQLLDNTPFMVAAITNYNTLYKFFLTNFVIKVLSWNRRDDYLLETSNLKCTCKSHHPLYLDTNTPNNYNLHNIMSLSVNVHLNVTVPTRLTLSRLQFGGFGWTDSHQFLIHWHLPTLHSPALWTAMENYTEQSSKHIRSQK